MAELDKKWEELQNGEEQEEPETTKSDVINLRTEMTKILNSRENTYMAMKRLVLSFGFIIYRKKIIRWMISIKLLKLLINY